jgi:hypothetical protein
MLSDFIERAIRNTVPVLNCFDQIICRYVLVVHSLQRSTTTPGDDGLNLIEYKHKISSN